MVIHSEAEFLEINVAVVARIQGKLPFDLFIRRAAGAFTRIFKKAETIDQERLAHYQSSKGVGQLYVQKGDLWSYHQMVESIANHVFKDPKTSSTQDILEAVKAMAEMTVLDITSNAQIDVKLVRHAAQTIQGCLGLMAKDPKALPALFHLMGKNSYAVKHSLSCSIFSLLVAEADGSIMNERNQFHLGMGAFLHDVGMTRLSFDPEEKSELSPDEWSALKEHPELGARMLDSIKGVPSEVREIVLQHHEQPNGNGYPNALKGPRIYYPAKIVAVADAFSAMIQKRPFRDHAFQPLEALDKLNQDVGKYDATILESLQVMINPKKPSG